MTEVKSQFFTAKCGELKYLKFSQ